MRKLIRRAVSVCIMAMMLISMISINTFAANDVASEVLDARNGIFQIKVCHVDNAGNAVTIQSGSGFLVGDSGSGAKTIITNAHVVDLTPETQQKAKAYLGVSDLNIRIDIVVKRDVVVSATILNESKGADFAILNLDKPIYERTTLALSSSEQATETQNVFALGFPSVISYLQDDAYYTSSDVNVTKGTVSKKMIKNSLLYIQHSAILSDGNSGGPLLDEAGNVIGINTFSDNDERYFYSLAIDEVSEVLDALGVYYDKADSQTSVPSESPAQEATQTATQGAAEIGNDASTTQNTVDMSKLNRIVRKETLYDAASYSTESYATYKSALNSAKAVLEDSNSSQKDVDDAVAVLQGAIDNLQPAKSSNTMLFVIIGGIAVIVVIIIILVIVLSGGSKKNQRSGYNANPAYPPNAGAPVPPPPTPSAPTAAPVPPAPPVPPVSQGAGATTVLGGGGVGATTVLSANNQNPATLVRVKGNESISINKASFCIGKERNKVDYCVTNNTNVSRQHANIIYKDGEYYIIDLNSTNCTYVNGSPITPNKEVKLNYNDKIKLADEEFQFR